MKAPGEVQGLLLAAELAINEAIKRLAGGLVGSAEDSAVIQLAGSLAGLEMARYHLSLEPQKK